MDCKTRILSENYRDLILEYSIPVNPQTDFDLCYTDLDEFYRLVYVNQMGLPPLMDTPNEYQNTPKLYGLMPITGGSGGGQPDPVSLTASGITQV